MSKWTTIRSKSKKNSDPCKSILKFVAFIYRGSTALENKLVTLEEQVSSLSELSGEEIHSVIVRLQKELLLLPQVEMPLTHHFSEGVYGRELSIPKGTLLIGKLHKRETLNILLKGEMTVASIEGVFRVKAPYIYKSKPGVKKLGFAHEDSSFVNLHPTDETDLAVIESKFIATEIDAIAYEGA